MIRHNIGEMISKWLFQSQCQDIQGAIFFRGQETKKTKKMMKMKMKMTQFYSYDYGVHTFFFYHNEDNGGVCNWTWRSSPLLFLSPYHMSLLGDWYGLD